MLRLGEFSTRKSSSFITSVDISWLDEFADKSTFDDFEKKYKLPETGHKLFNEIDYENLSGVSNPNLTRAKDALIFINALVELYKSEKFNFLRTYVVPPGKPLKDTRLFFSDDCVNFMAEFYHGFTPSDFFQMKNIPMQTGRIYAYLPIDDFSEEKHKISKGEKVELIFKQENEYEEQKHKIRPVVDFLKEATRKGHYVQVMT